MTIGWKLFLAAGVMGVIGMVAFLVFAFSALIMGHQSHQYRCAAYGVVEDRNEFWGVGIGVFSPVQGNPAGSCKP